MEGSMRPDRSERLALWWTSSSIVWLLVTAGVFLLHRGLPVALGAFRASGDAAIASAAALAVVGIGGLVLRRRNGRLGAGVIAGYSLVWLIPLVAALPAVWGARSSICLIGIGVCVSSGVVAGLMAGLVIAFSLVVLWAARACIASRDRGGA